MNFVRIIVLLINLDAYVTFLVPNGVQNIRTATPIGEIVGTLKTVSFEGASYQAEQYMGVPYAEAPVGNLRFRKPIPKARFVTPFDATLEGPNCLQGPGGNVDKALPAGTLKYSEDCLILNVYVPNIPQVSDRRYAVMVWIHGGGFTTGTSNDYVGTTLAAVNDVIVVTLNYRLAFLGFFSTQDADAPGNYGLWDQHLAIKWVHSNIQAFGGDPANVTIFGESAGASSVVHQMFYAGNQGLFQRVIAQSGTAGNSWGYADKPANYRQSMIFANQLGCTTSDHVTLMYCLRSKSTTDILNVVNDYVSWGRNFTYVKMGTVPIVDNDFVVHDPMEILLEHSHVGQTPSRQTFNGIDFMIGANSLDGIVYEAVWVQLFNSTDATSGGKYKFSRSEFENTVVPTALVMAYNTQPSDVAIKTTIFEYTDWSNPLDEEIQSHRVFDMCTDSALWAPTVAAVNAHARSGKSSTYLYKFSTRPPTALVNIPAWLDGPEVAAHADDLRFVFGFNNDLFHINEMPTNHTVTAVPSRNQLAVAKAMMAMWTNFAKTGDPNRPVDISQYVPSPWLPYNTQTETYLEITPTMTSQSVKRKIAPRAVEFWLKLLPYLNSL